MAGPARFENRHRDPQNIILWSPLVILTSIVDTFVESYPVVPLVIFTLIIDPFVKSCPVVPPSDFWPYSFRKNSTGTHRDYRDPHAGPGSQTISYIYVIVIA